MEHNCGFTENNKWFRYRAAAIIVEDGYVLFAGNEKDDYYYSIGGAVHMGETAEDAVKREVFEETGIHYEIDLLAVIHENFFNDNMGCTERHGLPRDCSIFRDEIQRHERTQQQQLHPGR